MKSEQQIIEELHKLDKTMSEIEDNKAFWAGARHALNWVLDNSKKERNNTP